MPKVRLIKGNAQTQLTIQWRLYIEMFVSLIITWKNAMLAKRLRYNQSDVVNEKNP